MISFHIPRLESVFEVFFNTLREYYNTYKFKNVNGPQFVELWKSKGVDIEKIIKESK